MTKIPAINGSYRDDSPGPTRCSNHHAKPFPLLLTTIMKILLLFIIIVPLLIGYFAGKSKSDLAQLATMAGLLILFILYLVFIDKPKGNPTQQSSPSSAQSVNCNVTCIHDDYSTIYEEERSKQHASGSEVYICDPSMEYPY
jgi:hypothetical protein